MRHEQRALADGARADAVDVSEKSTQRPPACGRAQLDPFAVTAMEEIGRDIAKHRPMTFEELEDWEGLNFDLIITLSPEAHHKALELTRTLAADVEYWPTPDPAGLEGSRDQRLDAYRNVRDALVERVRQQVQRPARNRPERLIALDFCHPCGLE